MVTKTPQKKNHQVPLLLDGKALCGFLNFQKRHELTITEYSKSRIGAKISNRGESEKLRKAAPKLLPQAFVNFFGVGSLGNSSESPIPFGMFLGCADAWGTAWEKARSGLVNFESRLGIFIDQIFGASKSDWFFLKLPLIDAFYSPRGGCGNSI
jgi:hypothetical protein